MKYLLTLIALLFIGCGDTPENTTTQPEASTITIDMVLNKSYQITTGDRVDNASTDAELKVITSIEGSDKEVMLIAGSAQLIRSN
jgi:ABC-type Fe3+-hydroxamate transport system substrate-binding protein